MRKVLLLGAIFLGLTASAQAHRLSFGHAALRARTLAPKQYWWSATDSCTITTGVRRDGSLQAIPYIQCTSTGDGWRSTPQGPIDGLDNCEVEHWGDGPAIQACEDAAGVPTAPVPSQQTTVQVASAPAT